MKWRRLKFLDVFKIRNSHTMMMVAACLHNFGLQYDDWIDDAPIIQNEIDDNDEDLENDDNEEELVAGLEKRRRLAEELIV